MSEESGVGHNKVGGVVGAVGATVIGAKIGLGVCVALAGIPALVPIAAWALIGIPTAMGVMGYRKGSRASTADAVLGSAMVAWGVANSIVEGVETPETRSSAGKDLG